MFIKCLLHCQPGRPPANSSPYQTQPENTLQTSIHHNQPTLSASAPTRSFPSSQAKKANSMTDEPCPDATHKVASGRFTNPILNSHLHFCHQNLKSLS